jgi:DNA-binding NtrC family response regulator
MNKRLLVVDDEAAILMAFKKILQEKGIVVDTADTLEDVKILLNEQAYTAVITDLGLSGAHGKEGLEVIRHVKEHYPETHVILMTAYGNPGVMEETYNLGAAFYFEKPVTVKKIKDALQSLGVY